MSCIHNRPHCNHCGDCTPRYYKDRCDPCNPPPPPKAGCNRPYNTPCAPDPRDLTKIVREQDCKINEIFCGYKSVVDQANAALAKLQCCGNTSAYYEPSEVWVEEKYSSADSAPFWLIHKRACDNSGNPIKMELKMAQNELTNSKIKQNPFDAAAIEYAQVLVPAIPVDDSIGWYGKVFYNGTNLPSTDMANLYTIGFTKSGRMKYYNNVITTDQLRKDQIVNSMGCSGILVAGGAVTDIGMRNQIPEYDKAIARVCIGQNFTSGEVMILVCGDEDANGMTSAACADEMYKAGCSLAAEVCEGPTVCALDKGSMMFSPTDKQIPSAYCYWYFSKKKVYCNATDWEIANLYSELGRYNWSASLFIARLQDLESLVSDLYDITNSQAADITEVKKKIAELESQILTLQQLLEQLTNQFPDLITRLDDLETSLNDLSDGLAKEIQDRIAGDNALRKLITDLQDIVLANYTALLQMINNLDNQVKNLNDLMVQLQSQMESLNNTVATFNNRLSVIEQTLDEIKAMQVTINERYTEINERMAVIESTFASINTRLDELEQCCDDNKLAISNETTNRLNADNALQAQVDEINKNRTYNRVYYKYVDPVNGNDANDGNSDTTPYQTISRALRDYRDLIIASKFTMYLAAGNYQLTKEQGILRGSSIPLRIEGTATVDGINTNISFGYDYISTSDVPELGVIRRPMIALYDVNIEMVNLNFNWNNKPEATDLFVSNSSNLFISNTVSTTDHNTTTDGLNVFYIRSYNCSTYIDNTVQNGGFTGLYASSGGTLEAHACEMNTSNVGYSCGFSAIMVVSGNCTTSAPTRINHNGGADGGSIVFDGGVLA